MMCGIAPNELCRWSEALPGQFGFTKQLVFRVALPHITLLFLSISYVLLGALILTGLDYGIAQGGGNGIFDAEHRLFEAKKHFLDEMLNGLVGLILVRNNSSTNNNSSINANFSIVQNSFQHFASRVFELSVERKHLEDTGSGLRSKSFIWNVFFSTTWLTSIGYGENAPSGIWKRLFCIVYLIFGIPLYLVTLADLAKFCTEGINRFYTEFVKMRFHLICWYRQRRRRIYSSEYSMEYLAIHLKRWRRRRCTKTSTDSSLMRTTTRTEEEMAEFIWKHLEKTHFVEVPFTLIYLLLLTYILCSTLFVAYLEQWTFFNSLYFIMMSVLTIGFGDIVPGNSQFILPILFIIIVGLIVATTFIDMVGAYYIDRLHFFGRRMDLDDPLEWLKAVQQRRIEAMKREAMRKLFETATAMYRFNVVMPPLSKLPPSPNRRREPEVVIPMPRGIAPFNVTADSVTLKWEPPTQILLEGKKFWYTLSYKMRTPQRMNTIKTIDFLRQNRFTINGLKSFTLYEFNVRISTNEGISKPARCQEYTEPCTVPQLLQLDAISSETATISWRSPKMNNGPEEYLLLFVQEPAPQFQYWRRYEVGKRKRFTLTNLNADTRYIVCILAVHNFGLATISRSLRFKTRSWWYEEEKEEENEPEKVMEKLRRNFLAPPNISKFMMTAARRPSLREPSIGATSEAATHKSSLQSGEYQDRS